MIAWLVRPPRDRTSLAHGQILDELRERAACAGASTDEVLTAEEGVGQGRTRLLLDPADAARLYRTLHTAAVAVFTVSGVSVKLRPHEPPHPRTVQPIGAFVRHKAAYVEATRPGTADHAWQSAQQQLAGLGWVDVHDARLLPMHCFDAHCACDLSDAAGRGRFDQLHRRRNQPGGRRRTGWHWANDQGHQWSLAKASHAHEPLTVGGRELPPGTHWDTALGRTKEYSNGWQVWSTAGVDYINIAPNAHVRAPHAQKSWDASDSPRPPVRAPQVGRSRAGAGAASGRKAKYPAR